MKNKKILIVEDEGIIAWDISDKLSSLGYSDSKIVISGEEALEIYKEYDPDLILMDINLNGTIDGIETAKIIYNHQETPIIFLTAYSDNITLQRAKATNPFGYILKPFSTRELHTSIDLAFYKFEMNKKLAASEKKYRNLFETSQAGIIITSFPQGEIIECNQRIKEMFGYSNSDDLTSKNLDVLFTNFSKIDKINSEILSNKKLNQYEIKTRLNNDKILWLEGSSWLNEEENTLESVFIDISERKEIEEKLRQSQKMETIGQIAAGIAHEINTPLAVISTRLEILKSEIEKEQCFKGADQIDIINKNIYRMSGIIERLLGFSRNRDSEFHRVILNDLLEEVLFFVNTQAKKKHIIINVDKPEDNILMMLHKNKIEQVFLNIIMNAFDAMHDGGKLNIKISKKNNHVNIAFSDTGEGISEDIIEKVFDPFFTTKAMGKGTGLGMYICYGIIKEMDGDIIIDSIKGEGTTITVILPLKKESDNG